MARKAPTTRIGIQEAAAALGRSRRCLDRWREAGSPGFFDEGGVTVVEVEAVKGWALSQGRKLAGKKKRKAQKSNAPADADVRADAGEASTRVDPAPEPAGDEVQAEDVSYLEARRRKELAQAKIRELQALKLAGELLPRAEVEAAALKRVKAARLVLISIPGRLADRLAGEDDAIKIEEMLEAAIMEALRELAGPAAVERKAARAG